MTSENNHNGTITFAEVDRARRSFRDKMQAFIKAGNRFHNPAPELSNDHVKNCKFVANRLDIIRNMKSNAVVAEVGVDQAEFSRKILDITNPSKLHLIDLDLSRIDMPNIESAVETNQCILHGGESFNILQEFEDEYFDWIYIDGDHYYEGVKKDIQVAKNKVKKDGLLLFNDYAVWSPASMTYCGVAKAVNEFCLEENWEMVYFCFQSMGYNDVALRKM